MKADKLEVTAKKSCAIIKPCAMAQDFLVLTTTASLNMVHMDYWILMCRY